MWRRTRVVVVVVATLFGLSVAPSSAQVRQGLADFVADVVSTLPGKGSHAFVAGRPDDVRIAAQAAADARAGKVDKARKALAPLRYDVVDLADSDGRSYLALRERVPCELCWGTYVINRSPSARNVLVEIPHPIHDEHTPVFGVEAFQKLNAAWFLMAGTHRYANGVPKDKCAGVNSDMARNDRSLFMAIHRLGGADSWALQYHGFEYVAGFPDVVISNGTKKPPKHLANLRRELDERGITAGVFDGTQWTDLGATCNVQGKHTNQIKGRFVHMEHTIGVRADRGKRSAAINAVRAAFFS